MTKQQIKDYEKVEGHLIYLKMWINAGYPDGVKDEELLELPLSCAISDMEQIVDNAECQNYGDDTAKVVRKAKAFLRKYRGEIK